MKRPSGRSLPEADQRLWDAVVATVSPLGHRRKQPSSTSALKDAVQLPVAVHPAKRTALATPVQMQVRRPPGTPLPVLDRRTRQKLLRGQAEIDARLDLHGETATTAPHVLAGFLRRARDRGHRTVLVMTGKGSGDYVRHTLHSADHWHAPERQGLLRRSFPEWIESPAIRDLVSGYQPAHPRHGGGGAWYVRLRRPRT